MKRKRRAPGEGSIWGPDDRGCWFAQVGVGYDDNGKRRLKRVQARSQKEVLVKLRALKVSGTVGSVLSGERLTVKEWLDRWLTEKQDTLRSTTVSTYRALARLHIEPHIGGTALRRLLPEHIANTMEVLRQHECGTNLRRQVLTVLRAALNRAVAAGHMPANPSIDVAMPAASKHRVDALTLAETKAFLKAAQGDRLYALYVLAVGTGMREGELLGLHWNDVDLVAGRIQVRQALHEEGGELVLGPTKSGKGRPIVLDDLSRRALKAHQRSSAESDSLYVFHDANGGPLRKSNLIRRSFKPLLKAAEVRDIRFHDLRHTHATLALKAGVHPKIVQERLGHASINITLDLYSHALPDIQQDAVGKLDALWAGKPAKRRKAKAKSKRATSRPTKTARG